MTLCREMTKEFFRFSKSILGNGNFVVIQCLSLEALINKFPFFSVFPSAFFFFPTSVSVPSTGKGKDRENLTPKLTQSATQNPYLPESKSIRRSKMNCQMITRAKHNNSTHLEHLQQSRTNAKKATPCFSALLNSPLNMPCQLSRSVAVVSHWLHRLIQAEHIVNPLLFEANAANADQ